MRFLFFSFKIFSRVIGTGNMEKEDNALRELSDWHLLFSKITDVSVLLWMGLLPWLFQNTFAVYWRTMLQCHPIKVCFFFWSTAFHCFVCWYMTSCVFQQGLLEYAAHGTDGRILIHCVANADQRKTDKECLHVFFPRRCCRLCSHRYRRWQTVSTVALHLSSFNWEGIKGDYNATCKFCMHFFKVPNYMDSNAVNSAAKTAAKCGSNRGAYLSHSTEQMNNVLTCSFI